MRPRRLLSWLAAVCLLFVLGLVTANVVDYVRFHRAVARAKGLTEPQLRALGDRCRAVVAYARFEGGQLPAEFHPMKPVYGVLWPGAGQIVLYEFGNAYLFLDVVTGPHNQQIVLCSNSAGPQTRTLLWQSNPSFAGKLSPDGRSVTVVEWTMGSGREWVVLENEICVFSPPSFLRKEGALLARIPLAPADRATITNLVRAVGPSLRGRDHRADNVADGSSLEIRFTPTGEKGSDDICLSNVWTDEVGPLIDAVSRLAPREYPIEYRQTIAQFDEGFRRSRAASVRSLKEAEAFEFPPPRPRKWCVWRRWFR